MGRLILAFIFLTLFSSCQLVNFYFTTMMSEPVQQGKSIYYEKTTPIETPNKTDITILMYKGNNIYAYSDTNINNGKKYNYNSIGSLLKEKRTTIGNQLRIFIKAGSDADYKNTVNMLDQMTINNIKKYSLIDQNENEKKFIKQLK